MYRHICYLLKISIILILNIHTHNLATQSKCYKPGTYDNKNVDPTDLTS